MVAASTTLASLSLLLLLLLILPQVREAGALPRLRHRRAGCARCAPGWGAVAPCDSARGRGTACARCAAGVAYSPHHSARAPCWLCSRCGPGLFEARACSPRSDTVCDSCRRLLAPHAGPAAAPPPDFYRKCLPAADGDPAAAPEPSGALHGAPSQLPRF
ncbi:uncharacterized protein LOC126413291 [Schistocerca serialis cubense]|uniref:uncharacterized protein LOC126413291 n=1 Tax=Schistocerca serialis cubense TaxID=2023355 RepID=UPI00214F4F90|nr:uncharacterized protein LOC126413291 [Schistocerca serialis cubense]